MPAPDRLVQRIAERRLAAEARAAGLGAAIPSFVERLRVHGATKIVLFGSLATGAPPHEATDIDLCVAGLDLPSIERLELELSSARTPLHLVCMEGAPPELLHLVERYGRVLFDEKSGADRP